MLPLARAINLCWINRKWTARSFIGIVVNMFFDPYNANTILTTRNNRIVNTITKQQKCSEILTLQWGKRQLQTKTSKSFITSCFAHEWEVWFRFCLNCVSQKKKHRQSDYTSSKDSINFCYMVMKPSSSCRGASQHWADFPSGLLSSFLTFYKPAQKSFLASLLNPLTVTRKIISMALCEKK